MKKILVRVISLALVMFFFLGGGNYLLNYAQDHFSLVKYSSKLSAKKVVTKNLIITNATFTVEGTLKKNVVLIDSTLHIKKKGKALGPILAFGSSIIVDKGGNLSGDITGYDSQPELKKGSKHTGKQTYYSRRDFFIDRLIEPHIKSSPLVQASMKFQLFTLLALYLLTFFHMFCSRQLLRVAYTVYAKPWWSLLFGILGTAGALMLGLLAFTTDIRFPLLLALLIVTVIIMLEGIAATATVFGKFLRKHARLKVHWIWLEILLGLMFLWAIRFIPIVGEYLFGLAILFGTGAVLFSLFGIREV